MIAILGTGKMGEALLSGLLRAGRDPADTVVTVRRREHGEKLEKRYGVQAVSNVEAARAADTLILTVKPQDMPALLAELGPHVPADRLVITVAAGIPTAFVEGYLADGTACVRAMSNTPALVDEAMSVISGGVYATEEHLRRAEELLSPIGKVLRIPETQQNAATALSGSGPAYFYYLVEAMTDAGILLGLPRAVAHDMIVQAVIGAAAMLRDTGEHPVTLREQVTSPAGTTVSGIRELERHSVRAAFIEAIEGARDRAYELAGGSSETSTSRPR